MERQIINNLKCFMCFFHCMTQEELMKHYIKYHKHDPQFKVQCSLDGCGATFQQWRTFRSHLYRNHSQTLPVDNEILENVIEEAEINRLDSDDIPMQLHNDEDDNTETSFQSSLEKLHCFAALFIVNIREHCKISQIAIDHIIDGVINLVNVYSTILIEELRSRQNPETQELNFTEVQEVYYEKYPPSIIFSSIWSKEVRDDILRVKFNMVSAETHSMGTELRWKKIKRGARNVPRICEVSSDAYVVPFLDNLRNLLNNQHVRENVENPHRHDNNLFRTVLDRAHYLESDLYQQHKNALAIIFYYDIIDVTKCFPQDAMHVLIEGSVGITCKLFLKYVIYDRGLFTLDELNNRIKYFDFGHFKKDKPALIEREHLVDNGRRRQTAAQIITLAYTLLFLIGEWILELEDENLTKHIHCFVTLLQVMNVCLAYEIRSESVQLLERMIEVYILNFRALYSNECLVPKFHLIIHIPQYIRMFGPVRKQWCFRFEATHAYFKGLVPIVRNFKNMALTLSYRHQARLCSRLASLPGMPNRKFLNEGDNVSSGEKVSLNSLAYFRIFDDIIVQTDCYMMRSAKLVINGTVYRANSIVPLSCNEDDLTIFGEIEDMFVVEIKKLLVISTLETLRFEFKLNAYYIRKKWISDKCVRNVEELIFPHPISSFIVSNRKYVPLVDHDRVEFY